MLVKHRGNGPSGLVGSRVTYATHPLDVVGWDGCLYPYTFNVEDFMPITGKIHQPPPVHQVFEGYNFVICNFCPRKVDYHEQSIPVPYYHSNVDSDEVMFYVGGDYEARKGSGINIGSISLHPGGHAHGPQPSAIEASIGVEYFDELAVMVDTFRPLELGEAGRRGRGPGVRLDVGRTRTRQRGPRGRRRPGGVQQQLSTAGSTDLRHLPQATGSSAASVAGAGLSVRHTLALARNTTADTRHDREGRDAALAGDVGQVGLRAGHHGAGTDAEHRVHRTVSDRRGPDAVGAVPQVGVEDAARGDRRDHHRSHEPAAAVLVVRRRDQDQRQVEAPVHEPGDHGGPTTAGELLHARQHVARASRSPRRGRAPT